MARTLKELAQEALDVQNACNLSGVALSFGKAMVDLREHCPNGNAQLHAHPVAVLWADKIASLTGTQYLGLDSVYHAYNWAHDIIKK
jgi:hypothetical protein